MPKRRIARSARCSESGSGIFTRALPKNPSVRPSEATAACEPFSSAALRALAASLLVMPSSWASPGGAQVTSAAQKQATMAVLMKAKLIVALAVVAIAAGAAALRPTDAAPQVSFATLSGEALATSDLRGKVLLVNFWSTSCVVCLREMPRMVETYKKFAPRGYEMIAVAMSYDHPNQVADFAQRRALPFKVAVDGSGEIAKGFGNVRVNPTTYLIDRQGRIVKRYLGEPDWGEFHTLVEKALDDPA